MKPLDLASTFVVLEPDRSAVLVAVAYRFSRVSE